MEFNRLNLIIRKVPTAIHRQQIWRGLVKRMINTKSWNIYNINNIPQDPLFPFGNNDVAEQFGLNGQICSREFKESNREVSFSC